MSKGTFTLRLWDDDTVAPYDADDADLVVATGDEGQFLVSTKERSVAISSEQARHLSSFLAHHAKADAS